MMKTMKKTIAIALAFCLAFAGVLSSKGVVANADGNITFEVESRATATGGTVYVAKIDNADYFTTVKVNKNNEATLGKWEKADPEVEVSVNPAKATYFAVKKGATIKYFKLAAAEKSKYFASVSYDTSTGEPTYGVTNVKKGTALVSSNAEWNRAEGVGALFSTEDAKKAKFIATLEKADNNTYFAIVHEFNASQDATDSTKIKLKGTTTEIPVTICGTADSKVVKIKLAKRAKGPAAAINYVKGEVTVPKGCAYRIVSSDGATTLVGGAAKYEGSEASFDATAAATKAAKVDVSKYSGGTVEVIKKTKTRASKITAIPVTAAASADGDLSFTSEYVAKTGKVSVVIENSSSDAVYEYKKVASGKTSWVKIPAKNAKTSKNGKVTVTGLTSGDAVTVRVQGNKAKQLTAGAEYVAYKAVGPAKFKASCDATPTASGNATGKIKVTFVSGNATAAYTGLKAENAVILKAGKTTKKASIANGVAEFTDLKEGDYEISIVWPAAEAKLYAPITAQTVKITVAS